ncbi:MAG: tetratricopeptide repeat protein [Lachnospiraceae bacterium]|nr:tetratricopeptide repeat protein [Lachnospiraceae bacterium]
MEHAMIFHVLGIQETSDEAVIKSAYLRLLKTTNPEDDPDGFKRLREAYEGAIAYARSPKEEQQEDKTEIGLWISQVDQVYQDIRLRQQPERWKKLLSDPLCEDLDTSLQTREAMIVYLMDHIYLPQTIWKLLDQTFQLTEDRELLSQQFPENFLNYMYYYIENPEAVDQSLFQPIDEGHMAADDYIRNYLDVRRQINWRKLEGCSQKLDSLEAFGLYHPYADVERLRILAMALETFRENGQPQDGGDTAVIRSEAAASAASLEGGGGPDPLPGAQDEGLPARLARAARDGVARLLSQAPESVRKDEYVRLYCAYAQWAMGQKEEAGCLWQKILDHMPTHYMAKLGMARYRMDKKEYCEAKELLLQLLDKDNQDEEALELMNETNSALIQEYTKRLDQPELDEAKRKEDTIELGWCLFQLERPEDAIALMEPFEPDEDTEYSYVNLFGRLLYRVDRYKDALPHLLRWLDLIRQTQDDGSDENRKRISREFQACHLLSGCYYGLEDREQALHYVDTAASAAQSLRDKLAAMQYKAYLLFQYKDYGHCIDACDQVIQEDSEYYPAYLQRQEAAYELHKGQQVVDDYYNAIRIYPGHYKPYLLAVRVFFYHDQFNDAKSVLDRARENQVEFSPCLRLYEIKVLRNLADNRSDRKKPLAIAAELMAEHQNPETDIEDLSEIEYETGLLHWDNNDLDKALEHMQAAIEENPERMQYRMIRGHIYLDHEEYKKALAEYNAAKEQYSDSPVLHYNCGLCQEALGMKALAIECYEEALKHRRTHREACEKLADFYQDRYQDTNDPKDFEKAIQYMDRQIEARPTCHDLVHRGLFYMRNMDIEKAIADFEEALKYGPDEWVIYNNIGCCFERLNDYEKAIGYFMQALEHLGDKKSLLPYSNLADCYEALGDYRKSIECYEKNLEIEPGNKNTFKELGFLYRYLGDYKTAISYFEKDPDNDSYYAHIGDIQYLQGHTSRALLTYKKGVWAAKKEQRADRYSDLAAYYKDQLLDLKKAEAYFLKALAIETEEDELHEIEWELATVCFRMRQFGLAKAHAQKSFAHFAKSKWKSEELYLNYRPYRPARLMRHAWLYICLGETEKGLSYFHQMYECRRCKQCRHRECYEGYLYLGMYYEAMEDYEKAEEYYQKSIRANQHGITAKATLEHLLAKKGKL